MKKLLLFCCFCMPLLGFAQTKDTTAVNKSEQEILSFAEVMPEFPGGNDEMYRFLGRNINYPERLKDNNIEGKAVVTFVIRKDGSLDDIKVINKTEKEFADEAIRVVKLMPNWTPGKENGKLINVIYTLPIKFYVN